MLKIPKQVMFLEPRQVEALDQAERLMFHSDFCPYLELKSLFSDCSSEGRNKFRALFTYFYGLNVGGLTDEFKSRYFEILFSDKVIVNGRPDFLGILNELSEIKRQKGDFAMPFSFVSKLVATQSEVSPIYDKHVLAFLGEKPPPASSAKATRIEWYVDFLDYATRSYTSWAVVPGVARILERLKSRDGQLAKCHVVRLVDFLVWKVGNQRLLAI